jgi:putative tricarboxylic transport membrane protein
MKRWWNFNHTAALVLAVVAAVLLASVSSQVAPPRMLFGRRLAALDPALYPRLVFGAMLLLALWYFVLSFRLREGNLLARVGAGGFVNVGVTVLCLLAYAFALPRLGFVASGAALIAALGLFFGNRNYLQTAAVALLVPAAIYFGLTWLMRVPLPEFPFF